MVMVRPIRNVMRTIGTIALLVCLLGCHGQSRASQETFEQVLQHYYDLHPVCIALPVSFPVTVDASGIEPMHAQLQALARAGLIETVAGHGPRTKRNRDGAHAGTVHYRVAPGMAKFLHASRDRFLGGSALCFAHRKIIKIVSFTAPAPLMGLTTSRVTYDFALEGMAPWVNDAAIEKAFPAISSALTKPPATANEVLVLAGHGWRLEPDVP